jgi:predicted lipoprotein with Yx(FWY)xxD motif
MKISVKNAALILLPALAMMTSPACKKDKKEEPTVKLIQLETSATLGEHLVDKDGRALYYFSNDYNGQNNCQGNCALAWPVFSVDTLTADILEEGLNLSDFSVITTADNKKQVTYKTWPLYYYSPNVNGSNVPEGSGTTTGENVNGVWFVAKPDYTIMLVNAQLTGANGKTYKSDYTEGTGKTLYFSDAKGLTLYTFKNDKYNKNNFTNATFSNDAVWPIYQTDKVVVPSALDKTLFSAIDVYGKKQLTYKGWPLYYFGQDAGVRGANKGVSVPAVATWPVPVKNIAVAPAP